MIRRKALRLRNIKTLILDEADKMLRKGFKEQIYDIYIYIDSYHQLLKYNNFYTFYNLKTFRLFKNIIHILYIFLLTLKF